MINSLKKSCVHFQVSPALQQPLMNCPIYASNLAKNLLIYINKYRDLHWWCTKKSPHEETYKLTLSQFCSSLQDPIGRKLYEKLWDDRDNHKLSNLQKCFDEATRAYKQYRVTEHRRELEVFETSVEINETTHHLKSNWNGQCYNNYNNWNNNQGTVNNSYKGKSTFNNGPNVQCKFCFGPRETFQIWKLLDQHADNPDHYTKVKTANSTTEFVKNRMGNCTHRWNWTWSSGWAHGSIPSSM